MGAFETKNPDFAAQVRESFSRQAFMAHLGAELVVVSPGRCEIGLAHRRELTQQHGYVHGGAVGAIVDSAMGYAGYSLAPPDATVLTVEYKLNLVAPAAGERLIARGEVVKAGRTLTVCRGDVVAVKEGDETLCATATQTLMIIENRSDGPG
jgi:uncharacterized protein (TIGR00369 family)